MNGRIAVIGQFALGSHLAHAINTVKTAGGFARTGREVLLLCLAPERGASVAGALAGYGEAGLRVATAPAPAATDAAAFGAWAAESAAAAGVEMVFARHFFGGLRAAEVGLPVVVETHSHPGDRRAEVLECFRRTGVRGRGRICAVVTISERLRAAYIEAGAAAAAVHVVPDGVDPDLFRPARSVGLPPWREEPGPHAVYCGHLYEYKGIPTVIGAARRSPGVVFHLVGGLPADIDTTRRAAEGLCNVRLHPPTTHRNVPPYLWHADVLILPPSARHPSAAWTSPVKLGEYLMSGRPIVASRVPGLESWVRSPEVRWFKPDDPESLVAEIDATLCECAAERAMRAEAAAAAAERFTYAKRAMAISLAEGRSRAVAANGVAA